MNSADSGMMWSRCTTFGCSLDGQYRKKSRVSDGARHPPIRLRIVPHLKDVLADPLEVPFAIEGLRAKIILPNSEIHGFESALPRFVQTDLHERRCDAGFMPSLVHIKPDELNWILSLNTWRNFAREQLRVAG